MATALDLLRRAAGVMAPVDARALVADEVRATLKEPPDWLWEAFGGQRTFAGERVTVTNALGLDAVFAAVSLLAGTVATLPLIVYRGAGGARQRATTDPRWRLLHDKPNPEAAADQVFENVMAHLAMWGNHYSEKVRSNVTGTVGELWPIIPSKVRVERDRRGRKRFTIDGETRTYGTETILHLPGFGYDGVVGLSVIGLARQQLGTTLARQRYGGRFFDNDATPGGVLQAPGEISEEAAKRLRLQWEAVHRGSDKRGRVAVLEGGMSWQSTGMPLRDAQFVDQERFSVNQVARFFGVPPEMIGGDRSGSLTYSTVEGQALQFVTFSLRRWLVRIEKGLRADEDLFDPSGDVYPEFLLDGLLRGDAKSRAEVYEAHSRMKTMTRNEIRDRENLPPLEGGDEFPDPAPARAPAADDQAGALGDPATNGNGRVPEEALA